MGCGLALCSLGKGRMKDVRVMGETLSPKDTGSFPITVISECCTEAGRRYQKCPADLHLTPVRQREHARPSEVLSIMNSINISHHGDNHLYYAS